MVDSSVSLLSGYERELVGAETASGDVEVSGQIADTGSGVREGEVNSVLRASARLESDAVGVGQVTSTVLESVGYGYALLELYVTNYDSVIIFACGNLTVCDGVGLLNSDTSSNIIVGILSVKGKRSAENGVNLLAVIVYERPTVAKCAIFSGLYIVSTAIDSNLRSVGADLKSGSVVC